MKRRDQTSNLGKQIHLILIQLTGAISLIGFTSISLGLVQPAWAQDEEQSQNSTTNDQGQIINDSALQLSDLNQPATTVDEWMAQIAQTQVQVIGVRVTTTETGLEIILEASKPLEPPTTSVVGNALIADIFNAVLALPEGDEFQVANPVEGIALVSVTGLPDIGVRIAITGVDAPPTADLSVDVSGLVLAVTPGAEVTETEEDAIQVVVTATRTEEEVQNVPRSVTVITREEIEQQSTLSRDLPDILGREVPGFGATLQNRVSGFQLRGRGVSVLIDGVPASFNTQDRPLQTIAPDAIERIEVVRGPNAVYGAEATGGTINIIIPIH